MTPDGFEQVLSAALGRRPFLPFQIVFVDGERITVSHPEAVEPRAGMYVFRGVDFSFHVFEPGEVSRIVVLPPRS